MAINKTLGTTPAVAAGFAKEPWTVGELTKAALEEMGEMNQPPSKATRYKRRTHVLVSISA